MTAVSERRFGYVDKPHIYQSRLSFLGHRLWCYNPVTPVNQRTAVFNRKADLFCRHLIAEGKV